MQYQLMDKEVMNLKDSRGGIKEDLEEVKREVIN